ncbi:MAG: hypothetical protein WD766_03675 [Gemmatimonadota bacterium]
MRRSLALALVLLLPMLVACDGDPAGPDTSHVGVYQLTSVNGMAVPLSFPDDGAIVTVVEGSLTLGGSGTFSLEIDLEITEDGQTADETVNVSGSYTKSGNTLTFDHADEDGGFATATLSGDVLTTTGGDGEVIVFEK